MRLVEVPAPARIAPYAVALTAEVDPKGNGEDVASGRFVLLHDPAGQEAWNGTFRVVTLTRATLEPELGDDPLLCEAAWSWVPTRWPAPTTTPRRHGHPGRLAVVRRPGRTARHRRGRGPRVLDAEGDVGAHLQAWAALLCTAAGLPPLPDGVTALTRHH